MTLFKETDDIIKLGKWAFLQIPSGVRCKGCPILSEVLDKHHYFCGVSRMSLSFDEEGAFKDGQCPVSMQKD